MSEKVNNISQLHPFEEVIGILHELIDDGGVLVARICNEPKAAVAA